GVVRMIPEAPGTARPFGPRFLGGEIPAEPRAALGVAWVVSLAQLLVLLERAHRELHRPEVLLQREATVSGVLQDGDAREVEGRSATRTVAPILHVDNHAAARVDGVPLVDAVDGRVLLH